MTFNEYQTWTRETAVYPQMGFNLIYPTLGLCGESGEFAEKVKKWMRDGDGMLTPEAKEAMLFELGDVLWYMARICSELRVEFEEVAYLNMKKLMDRKNRGMTKGSGDNR